MAYEPKEPTPITPLTVIKTKRERVELESILTQIAQYKALKKEAESHLDTDKKTGKLGLVDTAAGLMEMYGIKKTAVGGMYHTVTNGMNVSISQDRVKTALLKRGMSPDTVLEILGEVTKRTNYTTILTTVPEEEEEGAVTGTKYKK